MYEGLPRTGVGSATLTLGAVGAVLVAAGTKLLRKFRKRAEH
jgi:LPXTG-motif cell wall-anchored protein